MVKAKHDVGYKGWKVEGSDSMLINRCVETSSVNEWNILSSYHPMQRNDLNESIQSNELNQTKTKHDSFTKT
jgi:hypothetical protein